MKPGRVLPLHGSTTRARFDRSELTAHALALRCLCRCCTSEASRFAPPPM